MINQLKSALCLARGNLTYTERAFQPKLIQTGLIARGRRLPSGCQILIAARSGETRGIGQVEYLGADLEAPGLRYLEAFDQRWRHADPDASPRSRARPPSSPRATRRAGSPDAAERAAARADSARPARLAGQMCGNWRT